MKSLWRKWWIYPIAFVVLILVVFAVFSSGTSDPQVDLNTFLADVQSGSVNRIEVDGRDVTYEIEGVEGSWGTELERGDSVREILADAGITPDSPQYPTITVNDASGFGTIASLIVAFVPVVFILGIFFFFYRQSMKFQQRPPFSLQVTNFDPVCRNSVNPSSAAGSSTFMHITYYFCSTEHKQQFDADPAKYLLQK
jgi:YHS domain-containing protein